MANEVDLEPMDDSPSLAVESSNSKQPRRGKTRSKKWTKKRNVNPSSKVNVDIPECLLRAVGENAQEFITETGYLVRQHCPLNVWNWSKIDKNTKDKLMGAVKEIFVFPNSKQVTRALWKQLMKRYRSWRYTLRKEHYLKYKTDRERIGHCPPDVNTEQWKWLVKEYWGSAKFKHVSATNARNRSKQQMLSTLGTKSIARTIYEMRSAPPSEDPAELPEYLRLFEKERKKKDGQWVDDEAKKKYQELVDLHEEQIQKYGVDNLSTEAAFGKVLGHKSGYQKGMGEGPPPLTAINNGESGFANATPSILDDDLKARIEAEVQRRFQEREAELHAKLKAEFQVEMHNQMRSWFKEEMESRHGLESNASVAQSLVAS